MRRHIHHHDTLHHDLHHDLHHHQRSSEGHGLGRGVTRGSGRRAGRGAVAQSILTLLGEQPMHGYELITALEERSGGRWRPSPGAVYPALRKLEERGLISATEVDGKTRFELTESGRKWVSAAADVGYTEPWAEAGRGRHGDLHRALGELVGPVRQIGRFGTAEQADAAVAALKEATAELYRILATAAANPRDDRPE